MTDPVAVLISYLSNRFTCKVTSEIPEHLPPQLIVVKRLGGERSRFQDVPEIRVHCFDETDLKASRLALSVSDAINEMCDYLPSVSDAYTASTFQNLYISDDYDKPRYSLDVVLYTQ